jgi:hypothetical protein
MEYCREAWPALEAAKVNHRNGSDYSPAIQNLDPRRGACLAFDRYVRGIELCPVTR